MSDPSTGTEKAGVKAGATSVRHLPALDGLRGIAVLLVLWDHVPQVIFPDVIGEICAKLDPARFGVDLFFVLSGFLITRILLSEREAGVPVRYFLLRRAARIFPIYYLLLLFMAVVHPHPDIKWCAVYLSNYHGCLRESAGSSWLHHTWSLCVEEHFYSCWPLLVSFLPVRWSRRVVLGIIVPGAILSSVFLILLPAFDGIWQWIQALIDRGTIDKFERLGLVLWGTQSRVLSLAIGALFAYHEQALRAKSGRTLALGAIGFAAAGLLSYSAPGISGGLVDLARSTSIRDWKLLLALVATSLATGSVILLVITLEERCGPLARALAVAPLRGVGRISYGLYLYHIPVFQALGIYSLGKQGECLRVWAVIAVLFLVSTLSYFVLERPVLRWASRFRRAPSGVDPISAALRASAAAGSRPRRLRGNRRRP